MIKIKSCKNGMVEIESDKIELFINKEIITFGDEGYGFILNATQKNAKVAIIVNSLNIKGGFQAFKTGKALSIDIPRGLIGKIANYRMDILNINKNELQNIQEIKPIYEFEASDAELQNVLIEPSITTIDSRIPITETLHTGVSQIDIYYPIGKGQRELIIGDRQTGKTSIALNAIMSQKGKDVICIYVGIDSSDSHIIDIYNQLAKSGSLDYSIIISSSSSSTAAAHYITPYVAMAIAEKYQKEGKDVLIIFDDLSKHSKAYRSISLSAGINAGREAFPGDIFYIHARLLERAGRFDIAYGGGSITALPIIETQKENISNYIATNVISITDGQIFTNVENFNLNIKPAIDIGNSVSRVGSSAQSLAIKVVAKEMLSIASIYNEQKNFIVSDDMLSDYQKPIFQKGKILEKIMIQHNEQMLSEEEMVVIFNIIRGDFLNSFLIEDIPKIREAFVKVMEQDSLSSKVISFIESYKNDDEYSDLLMTYYITVVFVPFIKWVAQYLYRDNIPLLSKIQYEFIKFDNISFNVGLIDFIIKESDDEQKNLAFILNDINAISNSNEEEI